MNIGIGIWDLNKISSLTIFENNVKQGLVGAGNKVEDIFFSQNKEKASNPYGCDHSYLVNSENDHDKILNITKNMDHFLLLFPCPMINKNYKDKTWISLVKKIAKNTSVHAFAHEPFFERPMSWFREVADSIDNIFALQYSAYDSFHEEFGDKVKLFLDFPQDFTHAGWDNEKKEESAICPHYFKSWKHVDLIVRAIPNINAVTHIYNIGTEYYYLAGSLEKRKERYKNANGEWIWDVSINSKKLNYHGVAKYEEIVARYKTSKILLDASTGPSGTKIQRMDGIIEGQPDLSDFFGIDMPKKRVYKHINLNVLIEAIMYGAIPIFREKYCHTDFVDNDDAFWVTNEGSDEKIAKDYADKANYILENWESFKKRREDNLVKYKQKYDRVNSMKTLVSKYF